ncbi:hypothetical protein [Chitinophaga sp.]|uniref:hypothetical protein n=1 Tax=Chitinophaga sp. TaxID=1869181 RepID=UPI0031E4525C
MKKIILFCIHALLCSSLVAQEYSKGIVFPANYTVGDYAEFVRVFPTEAGASGYYEISISYTRGNIAAASTHIASISHANPDIWREAGRVGSNGYTGVAAHAFTVDCNTAYGNSRFRVRATQVAGIAEPITVNIKIRSINLNGGWVELDNRGNDLTVNKFVPMTNDWSLYVGNPFTSDGAALGLKVNGNGNVGIGVTDPQSKLAVAGEITAQKVKVTATGWPDYVFRPGYILRSLKDLERFILTHHHLPDVPSEREVLESGIDVADMNAKLLRKVEEQALYIIELNKKLALLEERINKLDAK